MGNASVGDVGLAKIEAAQTRESCEQGALFVGEVLVARHVDGVHLEVALRQAVNASNFSAFGEDDGTANFNDTLRRNAGRPWCGLGG